MEKGEQLNTEPTLDELYILTDKKYSEMKQAGDEVDSLMKQIYDQFGGHEENNSEETDQIKNLISKIDEARAQESKLWSEYQKLMEKTQTIHEQESRQVKKDLE